MSTSTPETVEVTQAVVKCNGDGGTSGHPTVYLNLGSNGKVLCPYCDRKFVARSDV